MKVRTIAVTVLATIFLIAAGNLGLKSLSHGTDNMSSLLIDNIEALSEGDDNTSHTWDYPDGIESGRYECGARFPDGKKCTYKVTSCQGGGKGCNTRPCNVHG